MTFTIRTRILIGFAIVIALALGVGLFSISKLGEVNTLTARIAEREIAMMAGLLAANSSQYGMRSAREESVTSALKKRAGLPEARQENSGESWRARKHETLAVLQDLEAKAAEYEKTALTEKRGGAFGRVRQQLRKTLGTFQELSAAVESQLAWLEKNDWTQLAAADPDVRRLRETVDADIDYAEQLLADVTRAGEAEAEQAYTEGRTAVIAFLVAALLVGAGAGVFIQQSISRPLGEFMLFVEHVGRGDLTRRAADSSNGDELGRLGGMLNQMVAGLRDLASQTRTVTENLNSTATEILAAAQQQAASTEEQAAAVQETTSTMEEVGQSGHQISDRARQVAAATEATSAAVAGGIQAVQNTNRIMESIREQAETVAETIVALSEKTQTVGDIIATVNDIAEQSNLLALNAAIEAAAAGEHGRSFSVLAAEIKNLAEQARASTGQVRTILGDIQKGINTSVMLTEEAVKRIESGKQQSDVAEQTIRRLSDGVLESVQAFQQIVAATNQQQIGFEQVSQAMKNIRQAGEQTVAGTRQLEKAASGLGAQGQQLMKSVERYKI
ncbi:MAG: hypothetical protein A3G34_05045 [Candidatus Lindowbacteria bacterium RIFCSPLOWO2_12_FULL_62_27]|nr:MAG: hypothetical protein A3I06_07350 [Candidatus Lindowbacteria bacterium RIFCSPLOWO2_02_FULL_62_12]OGH61356.1 MAG: hypothetical protein A3G34_05045 [Candidatus Lindowbacteria bacterium RIFCSPLOWO2_12_FULL_62_27]